MDLDWVRNRTFEIWSAPRLGQEPSEQQKRDPQVFLAPEWEQAVSEWQEAQKPKKEKEIEKTLLKMKPRKNSWRK